MTTLTIIVLAWLALSLGITLAFGKFARFGLGE